MQDHGTSAPQIINWIVVAWSAVVTAALGVWSAFAAVRQRRRDLRFRQTELALRLMSEIFDYSPSAAALELLDEHAARHPKDSPTLLRNEDIPRALHLPPDRSNDAFPIIRRCLDALLYYFDRFERLMMVDALKFEDIEMPWAFYAGQLGV